MDISLVEANRFKRMDLDRYTVIIMPSGSYGNYDSSTVADIEQWVKKGGTLVAFGNAAKWASEKKLVSFEWVKGPNNDTKSQRRPYDQRQSDLGSKRISGAIFQIELDLTHPLAFGYHSNVLPVFKQGDLAMDISKDAYSTPGIFTESPLISGYATNIGLQKIAHSAFINVAKKDKVELSLLATM